MLKKCYFSLFLILSFIWINAQRDSIFVQFHLDEETSEISVNQRIIYYHREGNSSDKIRLFNWLAAYQNRKSALAKRKLEQGKTALYFAPNAALGKVSNLNILIDNQQINVDKYQENIEIMLPEILPKTKRREIYLDYRLRLPNAQFTGYGKQNGNFLLKYFLIVPNHFDMPKYYQDLEETQNADSFWNIDFKLPQGHFVGSNLAGNGTHFQGIANTDLEIYISSKSIENQVFIVDGQEIKVEWGDERSDAEKSYHEFYLPLHLTFVKEKIGWLPSKIFINNAQKKKNSFLGSNDFQVFGRRLSVFSEAEKVDLDYFSLLSHSVLEQLFFTDKNKEHWLKNGIKTYLEIQYLKKFYTEKSLLGNFQEWRFLGINPLKWSYISKLKLIDRYGVGYHYLMSRNLDQAIGVDYEQLSDENQVVASQFEMEELLDFVSEKVGRASFEDFLKNYMVAHQGKRANGQIFIENLIKKFGNSFDFIQDYIAQKQRIDFRLEEMKSLKNGKYRIAVSKNMPQNIPFHLAVKDRKGNVQDFWLDTEQGRERNVYELALNEPQKLIINPNYGFPEYSFRNNFSERRWFGFAKKLKLKFITDVPNPEFNEVYLTPDARFNIYDKMLAGINFSNISLISSPFSYSVTPYFSIGRWDITGKAEISYKIQPTDAFFRNLKLGIYGANFHYNHDLFYRKIRLFSVMDFTEKPRSLIEKTANIWYQYIDQDLPNNTDLKRNYEYYGLWNFGFRIRDNHPIHEKNLLINFQTRRDFQKLSLEGIYEWQFAPKKQVQFRFFGGIFLNNHTKNEQFNFGVSRLYDYNFEYSMLGQSAVSGLFAQEFIAVDGGFKSYVGGNADQWITALNVDMPLWKMLRIYADVGFYKNKRIRPEFVWDSGLKMSLIPNILEVYFPMQSSLGFEPVQRNYQKKIRFSLNLDLDSAMKAIKKLRK